MTTPQLLADFISRSAERWKHCEGLEEASLLRLAILRELIRIIHSEKSHCLATGHRAEAQSFKIWEQKIDELRGTGPLEGDLTDLINGVTHLKKRTRLVPEALFNQLGREKLERYDRTWESALAAEACQHGWRFWTLEAWVEIANAETWSAKLDEILWPNGIVLFVETSGRNESDLWLGKWMILLHPRFNSPDELSLNFSRWTGSPLTPPPHPPNSPTWKLLFSPKKR